MKGLLEIQPYRSIADGYTYAIVGRYDGGGVLAWAKGKVEAKLIRNYFLNRGGIAKIRREK